MSATLSQRLELETNRVEKARESRRRSWRPLIHVRSLSISYRSISAAKWGVVFPLQPTEIVCVESRAIHIDKNLNCSQLHNLDKRKLTLILGVVRALSFCPIDCIVV